MELTSTQNENLVFFKSILPQLLADKLKAGKFVVVHDKQVQYVADTFDNALKHATTHFATGEFIIQQVIDESSTISFLFCAV